MRLEMTAGPDTEPVSRQEAKDHCRIEVNDDDALVDALIATARHSAEDFTLKAFVEQTWKQSFDSCDLVNLQREIRLRKSPVLEIVSVKGYASDDTETALSPLDYMLSGDRVVLKSGKSWPTRGREFDALVIEYKAGYGEAADVPPPVKQAIKLVVAHYYENREEGGDPIIKEGHEFEIPFGARAILMPFKSYQIL